MSPKRKDTIRSENHEGSILISQLTRDSSIQIFEENCSLLEPNPFCSIGSSSVNPFSSILANTIEVKNLQIERKVNRENNFKLQSFECSICREIMNPPYKLPCQHFFCGECIMYLEDNASKNDLAAKCPICQKECRKSLAR